MQNAHQENEDAFGVSESRFYMWRALFALAHADGLVSDEEKEFALSYFDFVPFSEDQKEILNKDLAVPQSVNEMLMGISVDADTADFFQFALMLVWCDGNYDESERIIIERLTAEQMNKFNKAEVAQKVREARISAAIRRGIEDEEFRVQAIETGVLKKISRSIKDKNYREKTAILMSHTAQNIFDTVRQNGVEGLLAGNFIDEKDVGDEGKDLHAVMDWMRAQTFDSPEDDVFNLWRAVFALAHADGEVLPDEYEYILAMMEVFNFSEEQRNLIELDIQSKPDIGALFDQIESAELQKRYFVMARTIIWCDGEFHENERKIISDLKERLGENVEQFSNELNWIEKKPVMPSFKDDDSREEKLMRGLMRHMLDIYQGIFS